MESQILKTAQDCILNVAQQQDEGYFDYLKLKILDNICISINKVHLRVEDGEETFKNKNIKNNSFGILLNKLEVTTIDKDGNTIFHDRKIHQNANILKLSRLEGLAVYLNTNSDGN